ncbi:MAG TPA: hypothetical protein VGJ34_05440 [Gaiellaceae bacterium]
MLWLWISIAIFIVLALFVVGVYNKLVRLRNRVENAWAQVDVQLRRRYDPSPTSSRRSRATPLTSGRRSRK